MMKIADTGKADAQPLSVEARLRYLEQERAEQLIENARLCQAVQAAEVENQGLRARVAELEAGQNNAYNERNRCVAVMAKMALRLGYPAGLRATAIEGWDESWHGCVWIDFPGGQASWHYHASDAYLFDGLPPYAKEWDGHSTPEKYEMMERYRPDTPQNPSICPVEPPVVVAGGDSTIELYKMPEWAEGFAVGEAGLGLHDKPKGQGVRQRSAFRDGFYEGRRRFLERNP